MFGIILDCRAGYHICEFESLKVDEQTRYYQPYTAVLFVLSWCIPLSMETC